MFMQNIAGLNKLWRVGYSVLTNSREYQSRSIGCQSHSVEHQSYYMDPRSHSMEWPGTSMPGTSISGTGRELIKNVIIPMLIICMSMVLLPLNSLLTVHAETYPDNTLNTNTAYSPTSIYGPMDIGWAKQADGSWNYIYKGERLTNQWIELDNGGWYHLDPEGRMQKDEWIQDGDGSRYYVDSAGKMLKDQVFKAQDGVCYYVDASGKMAANSLFQYQDGSWYYAMSDGHIPLAERFQSVEGGWYYSDDSGKLLFNQWIPSPQGFNYYAGPDGKLLSGWQEIGGVQFYFSAEETAAHPFGACYINETTPDGNKVDERGVKIQPVQQPAATAIPRANPYGYSCVEVDLTNQMMYCYIGNELKIASPCVTGRPGAYATTPGHHKINAKQRSRYLEGTNADGSKYKSWVNYWMPFHGGEGLHDASWRSSFGGTIYQSRGSHGCVNLPPSVAAQLYDIVYVGMPVIVHN